MSRSRTFSVGTVIGTLGLALLTGSVASAPAGAEQAPRKAKASFEVTIRASTTEVLIDKKVEIKGKVSPKASGAEVVLQKQLEGKKKWKNEATDTLNKKGKYSFVDKPSTITTRKYRVVKPASKQRARGVSPKVKVTVLRWTSLYDLPKRASSGFGYDDPATINAVDYPKSLVGWRFDTTGFIDWNLERDCTTLRVRLGMDDSADVSATALIDVSTDGASRFSKTYGFTQSEAKTFSIRGAFRLKFTSTTTNPLSEPANRGGAAALATPEVLCSF